MTSFERILAEADATRESMELLVNEVQARLERRAQASWDKALPPLRPRR